VTCPNKTVAGLPSANQTRGLPEFWTCLEELAADADFEERLHREFPRSASAWDFTTTDRRRFLQLMAASMALASASGCSSPPAEQIVPYVRPPEGVVPGIPLHFATAMPLQDGALGLVVTSHMGRPTKVEGNPLHPASLGATDAWAQASVLTLYDPDRSQTVRHLGEISTWGNFIGAIRDALNGVVEGAGIHIVSSPIWSPTLARQRTAFLESHPRARWYFYDPVGRHLARQGAILAYGRDVQPLYRFAESDVVLAIDSDFLMRGSAAVRYSHDLMSRRGNTDAGPPNRLYVVESSITSTGAAADHRLPLTPTSMGRFLRALAARLTPGTSSEAAVEHQAWLEALADDLQKHRGKSIVLAGDQQPPDVHALVHSLNEILGNIGTTIDYIEPVAVDDMEQKSGLRELVNALKADEVNLLVLLDCNPAYDAPPDLDFHVALSKARQAVHFGLYADETAQRCHWHIPAAHYLESWGDARAFDGTAAIVQPLIAPLYDGKTIPEVVSVVMDPAPQASYDLVRDTWKQEFKDAFEQRWQRALRTGLVEDSKFPVITTTPQATLSERFAENSNSSEASNAAGYDLMLLPDPTIGDGRFANNGWLQELPKPLTKLTWENAVLLAPSTAQEHGLRTGDIVHLECNDQALDAPVCVVPGHPAGSITCHLGYGRTRAGRTGSGLGFNAYRFRSGEGQYIARGARFSKTGRRVQLAQTQTHHAIDGRNIVRFQTAASSSHNDNHTKSVQAHESGPSHSAPYPLPSLLAEDSYSGFAWGMAIDLSKCHGCNACVVACQAENNIPIVGKAGVLQSREMHWLRLDLYYSGSPDNPQAIHQPMLCQHCEKAPCEVVCPVAATTHSSEGLNEMTYNRCIGTRYCSNNCPYKVRRFNFFNYQDEVNPVLKLLRNPEVTVRSRGVMEKCTYCVQRINHARIAAKKAAASGDEPTIADGTLQTACQQSCPTRAIVFGDINDANSEVARLKADPRNYAVLSELGTRPRTTYLAPVRNPNPALESNG
jgi:MoCo/4Fe-4S cofactor protein with predicted Tat translocation signal